MMKIFGTRAAVAAAGAMARHWNLPEFFADMIESHPSVERLAEQHVAAAHLVLVRRVESRRSRAEAAREKFRPPGR